MNSKRTLLAASTSALAAGVAQAAVQYSGPVNTVIPLPAAPATGAYVDLNNDGLPDFGLGFSGFNVANHQKPYIFGYPDYSNGSAVLARPFSYSNNGTPTTSYGLPVAAFGTVINAAYLAPNLDTTTDSNHSYFDQDGNGKYVGDWLSGATTEGYIGVEMFDSSQSTTNYGWIHIIFDDSFATATPTLTIVDYAYETNSFTSIYAGSTNTVDAPAIYVGPQSQAIAAGATAQLKVAALANPPPSYQWRAGAVGSGIYTNLTDSGAISGSTSNILTINGVLPGSALDYVVVVSNSLGAVTSSVPATITLVPPVAGLTPQVLLAGLTARFSVPAGSATGASYRWRFNSNDLSDNGRLSGAATPNLAVANLSASDNGNYDVVLSSGSFSVTSSVASLTVVPANSLTTYEAAVAAAGPAAYYRLNETSDPTSSNAVAFDNGSGFNGVYGPDVLNGSSGVAGPRPADGFPGFSANNLAARFATNDPNSFVTVAPWHLHNNLVTWTAWINPANPQQTQMNGIVASGTTNNSFAGIRYYFLANGANWDLGYAWHDTTDAGSAFFDSQMSPPAGQWSFVALVVTPTNITEYMFNAGGVNSAVNGNLTNLVMGFDSPEYIGTMPDGVRGARNFEGAIDEVAIFNRPMGRNELQRLYNAGLGIQPATNLQITRSGSNLQLSWTAGLLLEAPTVSGPWTTNSLASPPSYLVSPTNAQRFYRLLFP